MRMGWSDAKGHCFSVASSCLTFSSLCACLSVSVSCLSLSQCFCLFRCFAASFCFSFGVFLVFLKQLRSGKWERETMGGKRERERETGRRTEISIRNGRVTRKLVFQFPSSFFAPPFVSLLFLFRCSYIYTYYVDLCVSSSVCAFSSM